MPSAETQPLELWASHEVCQSLGWTRARLKIEREGDFPEPIAVVAAGRIAVWDAADVRSWYAEHYKDERAWRRAEAVRIYRRTGRIVDAARQLRAKPDSVRLWLREAGEKTPREVSAETHSL